MANCCTWINRLRCCRRQTKQTYIYLYNPIMGGSSSNHCWIVCILFGLCLAIVVILAAVIIYHINSSDFISTSTTDMHTIAKKRQLPDYVNLNIDPCEHFYEFVCDKWTRRKHMEEINGEEDIEQKWTYIRHEIHDKLMTNSSNQLRSSESMNRMFFFR